MMPLVFRLILIFSTLSHFVNGFNNMIYRLKMSLASPYRFVDDVITYNVNQCTFIYVWISIRSTDPEMLDSDSHLFSCASLDSNDRFQLANIESLNQYLTIQESRVEDNKMSRYFLLQETIGSRHLIAIIRSRSLRTVDVKVLDSSDVMAPKHILCTYSKCVYNRTKALSNILSTTQKFYNVKDWFITKRPDSNNNEICMLIVSYRIISSVLLVISSVFAILLIMIYHKQRSMRAKYNTLVSKTKTIYINDRKVVTMISNPTELINSEGFLTQSSNNYTNHDSGSIPNQCDTVNNVIQNYDYIHSL